MLLVLWLAAGPILATPGAERALVSLAHFSCAAVAESGEGEPGAASAEAQPLRIGKVTIHNGNIFDLEQEKENRRLFRLANHLHLSTRPKVIREQLLFDEGDPYSCQKIEESERLVRANTYIYDASIRTGPVHDRQVDVEVFTRDVWTLAAGLHYRREGGNNTVSFSLSDRNFLGFGKDLKAEHRIDVDRTTTSLRYHDEQLAGSRFLLTAEYADASDGGRTFFEIGRPFYSLDARWSAGLRGLADERVENLYERGHVVAQFQHLQDLYEVSGGLSRGLQGGIVRRLTFGLTFQEDRFAPLPETAGSLPDDRRLVYPWVGLRSSEDRYVELHDFDKMQRTEDRLLGLDYSLRLGYSAEAWGADRNRWIFDAGVSDVLWSNPSGFLEGSARLAGRWGSGGAENLTAGVAMRFDLRDFGRHLFHVAASYDLAEHLDGESQLLLGGDSGLRGYPLRYQSGSRRYRLTVEQRFYTDWNVFQLINVGAAVFADLGRAYFPGQAATPGSELLKDVGIGLRLGSSRSSEGSMVHFDIAFPLDGDASISHVQWLVRSRETF